MVPFRGGNRAKGLTRLLYRCPNCGREGGMREGKHAIFCEGCGMHVKVDRYGFLSSENGACPGRMDKWTDLQLSALSEEMQAEDFALSDRVHLFVQTEEAGEYNKKDSGILTLSKSGLSFEGKEKLCWSFRDFQYFILNDIDFLQIHANENAYRFVFEDTRFLYRWFFAHRLMMAGSEG